MPKGYWVAHNVVHDTKSYEDYKVANAVAFEKFGARFVIRGGTQETVEGDCKPRTVVLEFPSYQAAVDCYNSPEYRAALSIRQPISDTDLIIVEGYDG